MKNNILSTLKNVQFVSMVEILDYITQSRINFPDFLITNQFAWKPWFIKYFFEYNYTIQNVFWIDSGIVTIDNVGFIFEHTHKHGYWLTEDEGWMNYNFIHNQCKKISNATDNELEANQLLAGLSDFSNDKGLGILNEWC